MNPQTRLGLVLNRITARTRALGIRSQDAERAERNGNREERDQRLTAAVERLEAVADELEAI